MSIQQETAKFPRKLECLFVPSRYKILHGGRGGAKSWGIARALLILGSSRPLRILCGREIQKSIADSVHKLLSDQVKALGLSGFYEILKSSIRGANGTEFIFAGLKHNIDNIKSLESVDIAWIEEAHMVSKSSWDVLIPTIRKADSEIWVSFNPSMEEDETYQRFVVNPPAGATVVQVNWRDNPWFPAVLRQEKDDLASRDPDGYLNVWEGKCKQVLEGAVYAEEIRKATLESRIARVPYDATKPVHTYWDLGWADNTSIWFAQAIGFEYRVIDYYQNSQKPLSHYHQVLQGKGYTYDTDWLPHDARARQLGSGRSIEELSRAAGRKVQIVPSLSLADGINAARTIFGQCWFDSGKCADGLQSLRHYRYEFDPDSKSLGRKPLHDWSSHGADAFRYLAIALKSKQPQSRPKPPQNMNMGANAWMGM